MLLSFHITRLMSDSDETVMLTLPFSFSAVTESTALSRQRSRMSAIFSTNAYFLIIEAVWRSKAASILLSPLGKEPWWNLASNAMISSSELSNPAR